MFTNAYILRRRKLGLTSCREIAANSETGITFVRNDKPLSQDPDALCIRWGCSSHVPQRYVLNKSSAIHRVADKTGFRLMLDEHDLCPSTWTSLDQISFVAPVVVRPAVHHQGRRFYLCDDMDQVIRAVNKCGADWYASPFINKVAEYRVFVVQGRVACVAKKTPADPNAPAWNVAQGGRFDNVRWDDWPLKAVRTSVEAFFLSGLDFGGVDVMVDGNGECYVLEINSAPSLTSPYRQKCMAQCFDWVVRNGKELIPMVQERGGWRKFIHPAVSDRALMVMEEAA